MDEKEIPPLENTKADFKEQKPEWELKHTQELYSVDRKKAYQQILHKRIIFYFSLTFIFSLVFYFFYFSWNLQNKTNFDWHLLILSSEMIIPATVVMFALIKGAFQEKEKEKKEEESQLPAKDVLSAISQIVKAFKS